MKLIGVLIASLLCLTLFLSYTIWEDSQNEVSTNSTRLVLSSLVKRADQMHTMVEEGVVDVKMWRRAFKKYTHDIDMIVEAYSQQGLDLPSDILNAKNNLAPLLEIAFAWVEKANALPDGASSRLSQIQRRIKLSGALMTERLSLNRAKVDYVKNVHETLFLLGMDLQSLLKQGDRLVAGEGNLGKERALALAKQLRDADRVGAIPRDALLKSAINDFEAVLKDLETYQTLAESRHNAYKESIKAFEEVATGFESFRWVEAHQRMEQRFNDEAFYGKNIYMMISLAITCVAMLSLVAWFYTVGIRRAQMNKAQKLEKSTIEAIERKNELLHDIKKVTGGDLTVTLSNEGNDEMSHIASEINELINSFSNTMLEVKWISDYISETADDTLTLSNEMIVQDSTMGESVNRCLTVLESIGVSSAKLKELGGRIDQYLREVETNVNAGRESVEHISQVVGGARNNISITAKKNLGISDHLKGAIKNIEMLHDLSRQVENVAVNLSVIVNEVEGSAHTKLSQLGRTLQSLGQDTTVNVSSTIDKLRDILDMSRESILLAESSTNNLEELGNTVDRTKDILERSKPTLEEFQESANSWEEMGVQLSNGAENILRDVKNMSNVNERATVITKATSEKMEMLARKGDHLKRAVDPIKINPRENRNLISQDNNAS